MQESVSETCSQNFQNTASPMNVLANKLVQETTH